MKAYINKEILVTIISNKMSIENHSTIISTVIPTIFPHYRFVINKCGGLLMCHLYETFHDPKLLSLEEKEATHFLALSFHFAGEEVCRIEIESLRKTAHMSGKAILQQIYKLSIKLCIKAIWVEDNASLEFDVEKLNKEGYKNNSVKDICKRISTADWHMVKVKRLPLSPLLILCGQPAYYAGEGFLYKGQKKRDRYNKRQVNKTIREMASSGLWPGFNTGVDFSKDCPHEAQEKHLKVLECLDGYWDQPIHVFFQHVKNRLKPSIGIPEGMNFDFIKRFIEDLVKCEFIDYTKLVPLVKKIKLQEGEDDLDSDEESELDSDEDA